MPKYEKGKQKTGGITKGQIHKKTAVKLALGERIGDFDDTLYDLSKKFLADPEVAHDTWKHLTKLRVPTEKNINIRTIEDFLNAEEKELE